MEIWNVREGGRGSAGKEEKDQSEKKGKNSELGIRIGLERKKMNLMGWDGDGIIT